MPQKLENNSINKDSPELYTEYQTMGLSSHLRIYSYLNFSVIQWLLTLSFKKEYHVSTKKLLTLSIIKRFFEYLNLFLQNSQSKQAEGLKPLDN